eukprot:7738400-Pyramimonas_sp.AAC.1
MIHEQIDPSAWHHVGDHGFLWEAPADPGQAHPGLSSDLARLVQAYSLADVLPYQILSGILTQRVAPPALAHHASARH